MEPMQPLIEDSPPRFPFGIRSLLWLMVGVAVVLMLGKWLVAEALLSLILAAGALYVVGLGVFAYFWHRFYRWRRANFQAKFSSHAKISGCLLLVLIGPLLALMGLYAVVRFLFGV